MDTSKQRPNLVSVSRGKREQGREQSQRILARLEHGGKPAVTLGRSAARQLDSWIIGVSILVLVLAVFAWSTRDHASMPAQQRSKISGASAVQMAPVTVKQPTPPSDHQTAAIINEPSIQERPLAYDTRGAHGTATSLAAAAAATPALAGAHKTAVPPAPHAGAPAVRAATAFNAAPRVAGTANQPTHRVPGTTATSITADTDIALLTALVAHAGQPAAVTPEHNRDVVERRDGDGTEALLARCKQLGLIEGMLCRSRICAGRWDTDAACRAPNH